MRPPDSSRLPARNRSCHRRIDHHTPKPPASMTTPPAEPHGAADAPLARRERIPPHKRDHVSRVGSIAPMANADDVELDVGRWLNGLRRRKVVIITIVLTTVLAAVGLSLMQKKLYQATSEIVLQPNGDIVLPRNGNSSQTDPAQAIQTAIRMVKSEPVRATVRQRIGPVGKVAASRIEDTFIIQVKARSESRHRAALVADAYARAYVDLRREQVTGELLGAVRPLEAQIAELQRQIDQLNARLNDAPTAQRDVIAVNNAARRDSLIDQQAEFNQRVAELRVEASLAAEAGRIVPASLPRSPVTRTPVRNGILALIVGLLFAVALALVLEYFDEAIRTVDDLPESVASVPVLGIVPDARGRRRWRRRGRALPSDDEAVREAYRATRTAILHLGVEKQLTTIQVTSPAAGDGKSTTVVSLGFLIAAGGQRVVLVDCDLRRRKLHSMLGVPGEVGLTTVLAGRSNLAGALQAVAAQPGLYLLPAGPASGDPSELLGSKQMSQVVFELQSKFDIVLFDSPPALAVTDAVVLAAWVEATLVVIDAKSTNAKQLRSVVRLLRQSETVPSGLILNRADVRANYGYGYGYGYGDVPTAGDAQSDDIGEELDVGPSARPEPSVNGSSGEDAAAPPAPAEPVHDPPSPRGAES